MCYVQSSDCRRNVFFCDPVIAAIHEAPRSFVFYIWPFLDELDQCSHDVERHQTIGEEDNPPSGRVEALFISPRATRIYCRRSERRRVVYFCRDVIRSGASLMLCPKILSHGIELPAAHEASLGYRAPIVY